MTTMTRTAYCARLDEICDLHEAGQISLAEMDARLDRFKAATVVTEDAPAARRPAARKPAAPPRRAKASTVTLTRAQLDALLALPAAPDPREARAAAGPRVREKHATAIAGLLEAVSSPASLAQADLGLVLLEAGGAGHASPFYATEAAPPDAQPVAMSARDLAALPLEDFRAFGASQLAASAQSGAHRSPFWKAAVSA